ncbi:MAG: UDP-N-acetylmuramoyl-L-alanyl-D-glutamate--2,6-diaminopimelate ligase, partial [Gammaproteobacteria bacterium]
MSEAAHTGTVTTRSLAQLTAGFAAMPAQLLVSDVTLDSRAVLPGALFLACRGRTHHGLEFAADAVARGARAVL